MPFPHRDAPLAEAKVAPEYESLSLLPDLLPCAELFDSKSTWEPPDIRQEHCPHDICQRVECCWKDKGICGIVIPYKQDYNIVARHLRRCQSFCDESGEPCEHYVCNAHALNRPDQEAMCACHFSRSEPRFWWEQEAERRELDNDMLYNISQNSKFWQVVDYEAKNAWKPTDKEYYQPYGPQVLAQYPGVVKPEPEEAASESMGPPA